MRSKLVNYFFTKKNKKNSNNRHASLNDKQAIEKKEPEKKTVMNGTTSTKNKFSNKH